MQIIWLRKHPKQAITPNKSNLKYDRAMKKIKASREEIDQSIKDAFNMNNFRQSRFETKKAAGKGLEGLQYRIQVSAMDCTSFWGL